MNMMNIRKKAMGMIVAAMVVTGASAFAATPQPFTLSENGDYEAVVVDMVPQQAGTENTFYSENGDYQAVVVNVAASPAGSSVFTHSENSDYQAVPAI